MKHYEEVLHAIHYLHSTPETLNIRHFIVSCTELNGRFVSNDYEVQVCTQLGDYIAYNGILTILPSIYLHQMPLNTLLCKHSVLCGDVG